MVLGLMAFSSFLVLLICLRRYYRNFHARRRARHNKVYDQLIGAAVNNPDDAKAAKKLVKYRGCTSAFTRSLLMHFRTVQGYRTDQLRLLVENSSLERRIIRATKKGTRGYRMRAVQILSYLQTDVSLKCIRAHLRSKNRYERLTAARALTRRRSMEDCGHIVSSLVASFPRKLDLLTEMLVKFGPDIQPFLEQIAVQSKKKDVIVACLEALVVLAPASTMLDLAHFISDDDNRIRAAAVALSAVSEDVRGSDLLLQGLSDDTIKVKIRSAKIAANLSRPDVAPALYTLTKDPSFWVKYWASRGIWKLGKTGRQMIESIANSNEEGSQMAGEVAREMGAGHV